MGVLCSLTVGRDKIDQGRLKKKIPQPRLKTFCCVLGTYPIGSTVNQWSESLIDKEAFAAGVLHCDWIIGGLFFVYFIFRKCAVCTGEKRGQD